MKTWGLKQNIHTRIDLLWKNKIISRGEVYKMLHKLFGKEIHMSTATEEELRMLHSFLLKYKLPYEQ